MLFCWQKTPYTGLYAAVSGVSIPVHNADGATGEDTDGTEQQQDLAEDRQLAGASPTLDLAASTLCLGKETAEAFLKSYSASRTVESGFLPPHSSQVGGTLSPANSRPPLTNAAIVAKWDQNNNADLISYSTFLRVQREQQEVLRSNTNPNAGIVLTTKHPRELSCINKYQSKFTQRRRTLVMKLDNSTIEIPIVLCSRESTIIIADDLESTGKPITGHRKKDTTLEGITGDYDLAKFKL